MNDKTAIDLICAVAAMTEEGACAWRTNTQDFSTWFMDKIETIHAIDEHEPRQVAMGTKFLLARKDCMLAFCITTNLWVAGAKGWGVLDLPTNEKEREEWHELAMEALGVSIEVRNYIPFRSWDCTTQHYNWSQLTPQMTSVIRQLIHMLEVQEEDRHFGSHPIWKHIEREQQRYEATVREYESIDEKRR